MHSSSIEHFLINELDFSIAKRHKAQLWIEKEAVPAGQIISIMKQSSGKSFVHLLCFCDTFSRVHTEYFIHERVYFLQLAQQEKNESNKRSLTNLFITFLRYNYSCFKGDEKEILIERCFQWLIDESAIATQCNCLTCLDILANDYHWVKEELLLIIDKDFKHKPASYQSRAKKIIKKHRSF